MSNMPIKESTSSNCKLIYTGIALTGAAIIIGGIFVTLAAFQVLPHGVNVISQLGERGECLGYGICIVGAFVTALFAGASAVCIEE